MQISTKHTILSTTTNNMTHIERSRLTFLTQLITQIKNIFNLSPETLELTRSAQ